MDYNWNDEYLKRFKLKADGKTIFLDLNLYQLIALKKLLDMFTNSTKKWTYYISKAKRNEMRIVIHNIKKMRWIDFDKNIDEVLEKFIVHLCIDCKDFNKITVESFYNWTENFADDDVIVDIANNIVNTICDKIKYIYESVKNAILIENFFYESFQFRVGECFGYHDFDNIVLDCGSDRNVYDVPKVIKCKIKYYKILLPNFKYQIPSLETLYIDRKIIITLIQLLSRSTFAECITDGRYITYGSSMSSNLYINLDRSKIIDFDYREFPSDTKELINKFYKLDYERQNLFLNSCEAYIEGVNNWNGKSITFFVIALENLANFIFRKKAKLSKKKRIYNLIKDVYDRVIVSQEFIDYVYSIRSLYSHEGVANNRLKQCVFNINETDNKLILKMESLTYSVLTKWLEVQVI